MNLNGIREFFDRQTTVVLVGSYRSFVLKSVGLLVLTSLVLLFGYFAGLNDFLKLGAISMDEYSRLSHQYRAVLGKKSELDEENLDLGIDLQVSQNTHQSLRDKLVEMQVEIKRLNDELLFYRHLHESDRLAEGLRVQSFELKPIANADRRYRYTSIISYFSAGDRNAFFEGYYEIIIEVQLADQQDTVKQIVVTPKARSARTYKFKLIHTIKGEFALPADQKPLRLFFKLQPRSRSIDTIESIYNFNQLLTAQRKF